MRLFKSVSSRQGFIVIALLVSIGFISMDSDGAMFFGITAALIF